MSKETKGIDFNRLKQKLDKIHDNFAAAKGRADLMITEAMMGTVKQFIDEIAPIVELVNSLTDQNTTLKKENLELKDLLAKTQKAVDKDK